MMIKQAVIVRTSYLLLDGKAFCPPLAWLIQQSNAASIAAYTYADVTARAYFSSHNLEEHAQLRQILREWGQNGYPISLFQVADELNLRRLEDVAHHSTHNALHVNRGLMKICALDRGYSWVACPRGSGYLNTQSARLVPATALAIGPADSHTIDQLTEKLAIFP